MNSIYFAFCILLFTLFLLAIEFPVLLRITVSEISTCAISTYYHKKCEFESRSWRGVLHTAIMFLSDLRQVGGFTEYSGFLYH
jgi:hypothetical protein